MKRAVVALAWLVATASLGACGSEKTERPEVVATAYPLFEAAATVGGKHVHAVNLLPLDPYTAVPEKKARQLRTAALAIVLGGGTQPEVDKIVAERKGPTLRILDDTTFRTSGVDQNVWLDPLKMVELANTITDELTGIVPAKSEAFRDNLAGYEADISGVDRNYAQTFATCKRRTFLVERPEFTALARRYGLEQVTVGSLDIETSNSVAVAAIERTKSDTVFAVEQPSLSDAGEVQKRYGVRVAVLDPIDSQTDQARRGGATYRSVMGINLDALRAALSCAPKEH